jgi:hypothetical protein
VHRQNLLFFRKQLSETTDGTKQQQLFKLLSEEEAKDQQPPGQEPGRVTWWPLS